MRTITESWGAGSAHRGQAKVGPKVEVEGLELKNQNRVKEERPDLEESTQRQRSTSDVSAWEIPRFAADTS